ncbi:MAG TPA: transglutaminase family protein [Pirellulales bacterium]|jgi:uncharacterized protein (DUF2126 family)/transglutaminase-like putative cysteine protease|nr:transglutaminase family protein [Pirellulales bacterium]
MSIRVAINHKTTHHYARPVWLSPHVLRLHPAPHCRTPIVSYSLKIAPAEHFINWQQDPYSNRLARIVFPKPAKSFSVEVDLVAEMTTINPFDFFLERYAEQFPFSYDHVLTRELSPYLHAEPAGPLLAQLIGECRTGPAVATIDYLVDLNQRIQRRVKYLIRLEPGIQAPEETLRLASGSCRDSAWLLVQLFRHVGLAARFVSGYLVQLRPDVKSLDGPSGAEQDFTDLHAWTEVYLPGAGWIGLDPTSGLLAGEGHLPLACSADPVTAAAVTGFFSYDDATVIEQDPEDDAHADASRGDHFDFSMSVTRIHEDPRVTKPYTDAQWAEIEALGHQIDADLRRDDVRLTMGGEPTFVSIDDMDGEEWNTAALGENKYRRADELVRRLRDCFAPGGFLHHGQGKWYPGESLPRWGLGLYWRKDGEPVWRDTSLVADEMNPLGSTEQDAAAFVTCLAQRLGVDISHIVAGYEDAWYWLWKERRLPVNVDPFDSNLKDADQRALMAKVFERGLQTVVGYALPLGQQETEKDERKWISGPWFLRPERMYLVPGNSPMGFRLPLESIPWVAPEEYPHLHERDAGAPRPALPARADLGRTPTVIAVADPRRAERLTALSIGDEARLRALASGGEAAMAQAYASRAAGTQTLAGRATGGPAFGGNGHTADDDADDGRSTVAAPKPRKSSPETVRTALCTEVRDGVLRVFMPPVEHLEDYLDLVAAIEETAAELKHPVLVEGYTPPHDPRVHQMKVTPDPGVIEANTHPVETWDDLVRNTNTLYEEARRCRLGTEKFMLDGRHTGTGGGNHIVLGGPTPADSPLLRRPDLLRSLVGFWNNHPCLSYLFSGAFVGPTSQAPRIDEARNDQVHEIELAFKQIPDDGGVAPWLVDRVFRNLLVDAAGNTHRTEMCIDKLYAPESARGRLGLLEMRGFEMPPHARMSLTQHLLIRALVALFWRKPYRQPLVRWRTEIHDRFMLPHFVFQDLEDVIGELNQAGYPLKSDWFATHLEFRFPVYGKIEHRGIVLQLRQAVEPWHVLGEVPGIHSAVRQVDSSLERLEVLVDGMIDPRHRVTCNRIAVPLHPTGTNGQYVAGVRYRAWQPAECLHPTIGVHAPLVFDVVDTWSDRSVGGCTYHVSHPGGRNYERFPVNAYEAEGRRAARFLKFGHTPGTWSVIEPPVDKEFPFTLDLRRV